MLRVTSFLVGSISPADPPVTIGRVDDGKSGALYKFFSIIFYSQSDFYYKIKIIIILIFRIDRHEIPTYP